MVELIQLRQAFMRAHEAGDTQAAGVLATAIKEQMPPSEEGVEAQDALDTQARLQAEQDLRDADSTALGRGLSSGVDQMQQGYGSFVEGVGNVLGLEGLAEYGATTALDNEANVQRAGKNFTPYEDAEGLSGLLTYAGETLGAQLPIQAPAAALSAAAIGLTVAGLPLLAAGATAAAALSYGPMMLGFDRERQIEELGGDRTKVNEGAAFIAAVGQTGLELIANRIMIGGVAKAFTPKALQGGGIFTKKTLGRAGLGGAKGAIIEVPTEIGQQLIERAQAGLPIDDDEAIAEYQEAARAALLVGGVFGGTAGTFRGAGKRDAAPVAEGAKDATEDATEGDTLPQEGLTQGELFSDRTTAPAPVAPSGTERLGPVETQNELFDDEDILSLSPENTDDLREAVDAGNVAKQEALDEGKTEEEAEAIGKKALEDAFEATRPSDPNQLELDLGSETQPTKKRPPDRQQGPMPKPPVKYTMYDYPNKFKDLTDEINAEIKKTGKISVEMADRVQEETGMTRDETSDFLSDIADKYRPSTEGGRQSDLFNIGLPATVEGETIQDKPLEGFTVTSEGDVASKDQALELKKLLADRGTQAEIDRQIKLEIPTDKVLKAREKSIAEALRKQDIEELRKIQESFTNKDVFDFLLARSPEIAYLDTFIEREKNAERGRQDDETRSRDGFQDSRKEGTNTERTTTSDEDGVAGTGAKTKLLDDSEGSGPDTLTVLETKKSFKKEGKKYIPSTKYLLKKVKGVKSEPKIKVESKPRKKLTAVDPVPESQKTTPEVTPDTEINSRTVETIEEEYKNKLKPLRAKQKELPKLKDVDVADEKLKNEIKNLNAQIRMLQRNKEFRIAILKNPAIPTVLVRRTKSAEDIRLEDSFTAGRFALELKRNPKLAAYHNRNNKKQSDDTTRGKSKETSTKFSKTEPLNTTDRRKIINLVNTKTNKLTPEGKAAKIYFLKNPTFMRTIQAIAIDHTKNEKGEIIPVPKYRTSSTAVKGVSLEEDIAYYSETGGANAKKIKAWIKDKLSPEVTEWINSEVVYYTEGGGSSDGGLNLPIEQVNNLDIPLRNDAITALKEGRLADAINLIIITSPNIEIANMARALFNFVGTTKLSVVSNLKVAGSFDPKTNTIKLNEESGLNVHTLLHELAHAALSATIANPNNPTTKQLNTLFNEIKDQLDTAYGAQNLQEFVAEVMSNPKFQSKLAGIVPKGEKISPWKRFVNILVNRVLSLLGRSTAPLDSLSEANRLIKGILAPAPESRDAPTLALRNTPEDIKKIAADLQRRAKEIKPLDKQWREGFGQDVSLFLYDSSIADKIKNFFLGLLDSLAMGDVARAVGLGDKGDSLDVLLESMRGDMRKAARIVRNILSDSIMPWVNKNTANGMKTRLDNLIYSGEYGATIHQVDPELSEAQAKKKYGENSNKFKVWKAQRPDWVALQSSGGDKIFRLMRDYYTSEFVKFKNVLMGQLDTLTEGQDPAEMEKLKASITSKLFSTEALDVYFPLTREGKFKLSYSYKADQVPFGELKSDSDPFVYRMFNTRKERDAALAKVLQDDAVQQNTIDIIENDISYNSFKNAPPGSFVLDIINTLNKYEVEGSAISEIINLYMQALPETAVARIMKKREVVAGYEDDFVLAFKLKANSLSAQTQQLKYNALLRKWEYDLEKAPESLELAEKILEDERNKKTPNPILIKKYMRDIEGFQYVKNKTGLINQIFTTPAVKRVKRDLMLRAKFGRQGADNKAVAPLAKRLNQGAFVYTIGGNISSAVVNLSQLPMFVFPYLGAEYGYSNTYKKMVEAGSIAAGFKGDGMNDLVNYYDMDNNGILTIKDSIKNSEKLSKERIEQIENIQPLVQEALDRGHLDLSYIADALGATEFGQTREKKDLGHWADQITTAMAFFFNHGERLNRQTTLVASYLLALEKIQNETGTKKASLEQQQQAAKISIKQTRETNGGSTLETGPRHSQQNLGRIAFMYKSFGLRMYTTMLKSSKSLINNMFAPVSGESQSEKEQRLSMRKLAFRQLAGVHGSVLLLSGVHGLPLYGAVSMVASLFFFDEGEEEDFNTWTRSHLGEGWYKGAVNAITGVDVASRIRLTGLLLQHNRYNRDASVEEDLAFYIGGPAWSTIKKLERSKNQWIDGEYERSIESAVPASLANLWKASFGRYRRQGGIYTKRGDPIYTDMSQGELAAQMFGFPPAEYIKTQEKNAIVKNIDSRITKQRSTLTKKYYVAKRLGDFDLVSDIIDDIEKFNLKHPTNKISPKNIRDSLKRHAETTKKMYDGIYLNDANRVELQRIIDMFE